MGLCHRECEKCTMFFQCGGCSFCEMPFCKHDCQDCFSLCAKRGGSYKVVQALGGGNIELLTNKSYDLPSYIAIIPDHLPNTVKTPEVIGIHGGTFLSRNGERVNKKYLDLTLQEIINTEDEIEGVLQFYVKDRTLEGFWDNRELLYKQLKLFKWRAVIAPNFSVYEDAPRIDHLYNIQRSSIVYNELIRMGLPAIPDLSWYNQIDLDQWIREINKNKLKTISFSFQVVGVGLKASNHWKHYLMAFKYISQRIDQDVAIVICGVVSPKRVEIIKRAAAGRKVTVLNQSAYVQSRRGYQSQTKSMAPKEMSKDEILLSNFEYYAEVYGGGVENAENEK